MDPAIKEAAEEQGMTVAGAKEKAAEFGMTLRALLGLEDAPVSEVAFTYVRNGPLVEPAQEASLPTQMRKLHDWYLEVTQRGLEMILMKVTEEHFKGEDMIQIYLEELFQLCKMDTLDLSIISAYCL